MNMEQEASTGAASAVAGIALKSGPPTVATGAVLLGYSLQDWVCIATLVWIGIQAGFYLFDRIKRRTGK